MQNKKHRRLFLETLESRIVLTGPAVNIDGLVSWYRAEGNANDSENANNGAFVADVGVTPAAWTVPAIAPRNGKAFSFNSAARRVEIADSPSLSLQAFTIDAWVYSTYPGSFGDVKGGEIVGKALPNQLSGVSVSILGPGNTGHFTFAASLSDNSQPFFTSADGFAINQWHHVAMTSDGSTIRGYVDGVMLPGAISLTGVSIPNDPAAPWTIGGHPAAGPYGQHYYEGLIDEVGFYQRGLSTTEVQSLYNQPTNTTPIANNNAWSVNENQVLNVPAAGVLANDVDTTGGNAMTAALVAGPSHGNVTLNSDGSFTYTPAANYSGSDSYTYKANDGTVDSNVATVNITVIPVNNPPVAVDNAYGTAEDTVLTVATPGILANDSDVDLNPLTSILVTGPSHGTLTQNTDGSFTYTPAANYNGPDSYTYKANDGTVDSNVATVNITVTAVNDPPVTVDDAYSTAEDTALTVAVPGILANDTDVEGGPLTSILVTGPSHGTLTQNSDGSFTYTPAANYNGTDSYTYKANDGAADSNVATVNITVTPVNDAPLAANDSYTTPQDTVLTAAAPGVLANDSDVDGGPLTSMLVTGPSHGTLTQNSDGSFTYTPAANYSGSDSYTYKANDGTVDSNVATVSITVTPVNVPSVQMLNDPDRPGKTMLVVTGTNGNDTFQLTPTSNAGEYRLHLNGLNLGAYSPTGSVQVYGDGGVDTFVLNGNSSSNIFEVRSDSLVLNTLPFFDHAIASRQINALGSGDTITVYGGSATIDGGAAGDTLVATGAISHDWRITAQNTGSLDGLVFFSSVEQLVGGAGADTLTTPDSANTWKIESTNAGTLKNTSFSGMETLRGGSAADTFRIMPGASFAGTLEGGGGADLLDYSAFTTAVTVNLGLGTATGVGGVSGFEDISGGDGNDFLVGNAADNDISGGNGDDIILGLSGSDTLSGNAGLDFVAGGSGADLVHGNNTDDILVGGSLTYANESTSIINLTALDAIMAEWRRTLAYSLRIDHLSVNSNGGFNNGYMLNSNTVVDDGAVDTLIGDTGQDWFLAGINDVVKSTKGETVTL